MMNREDFLALLSRRLTDGLTVGEEEGFNAAIQSNETFAKQARELTTYFNTPGEPHTSARLTLNKLWQQIEQAEYNCLPVAEGKKNALGRKFPAWLRIAAVILLFLSAGTVLYNYYSLSSKSDLAELNTTDSKLFVTLADGTQVSLNRQSSISYNTDFGISARKIILRGEAFFDVVKNKNIPLYIQAGNISIEVKGTAFNVNAYDKSDKVEVALIRGSVEITSNIDKRQKVVLKPNEKLIVASSSKKASNFRIIPLNQTLLSGEIKWSEDSLIFKNQKLKDLAARMEKKYQVKIEIKNEALKNKRFSGTFAGTELKYALEALKISYPFNYKIVNQLVIIE